MTRIKSRHNIPDQNQSPWKDLPVKSITEFKYIFNSRLRGWLSCLWIWRNTVEFIVLNPVSWKHIRLILWYARSVMKFDTTLFSSSQRVESFVSYTWFLHRYFHYIPKTKREKLDFISHEETVESIVINFFLCFSNKIMRNYFSEVTRRQEQSYSNITKSWYVKPFFIVSIQKDSLFLHYPLHPIDYYMIVSLICDHVDDIRVLVHVLLRYSKILFFKAYVVDTIFPYSPMIWF